MNYEKKKLYFVHPPRIKTCFRHELPNLVLARSGVNFFTVLFAENGGKKLWISGPQKYQGEQCLKVLMGPMSNPMSGFSCAIKKNKK